MKKINDLNFQKQGNRQIDNSIIVTGNGFDLTCGLESGYEHFFKWCTDNIENYVNVLNLKSNLEYYLDLIRDYFKKNDKLSIWDLYFIIYTPLNIDLWCNIEKEIHNSININFWDNVLLSINYYIKNLKWQENEYLIFSAIFIDRYYGIKEDRTPLFKQLYKPTEITSQQFYDDLLQELSILETRFSKYLTIELEKNDNYYSNQNALIKSLLKFTTENDNFKILSFNYTPYDKNIRFLNIHGNLSNPIFGISDLNNKHTDAAIFTKSFRRTIIDLPHMPEFIGNQKNNIIFYGTSFNDLDFDHYNLIINSFGDGQIFFCYSNYGGKDRKSEYIKSVKRLIEKLESNFLHLIEHEKIIIKEINTI